MMLNFSNWLTMMTFLHATIMKILKTKEITARTEEGPQTWVILGTLSIRDK